jgi:uncharacterized membrane protein (DUF485 family)
LDERPHRAESLGAKQPEDRPGKYLPAFVDRQSKLELERPRSIWEMLVATFELYRRVPFFFLILAAIVVVPYEVIVLVITGKGPLALGQMGFVPRQLLVAIDSFLVTPLVSALHVHAAREVG